VREKLDSAALASALTADTLEDRVLGRSAMVRLPVRCLWVATGNNPTMSNEMARRTIRIRLDAHVEKPWLRNSEGFRHPNLKEWVGEHRGELIWAVLTIVRAWLAAGQPKGDRRL